MSGQRHLPADHKIDIREQVLLAAEECFARYTISKTTMDDVAKTAGVVRRTVYRHFPDRDSLVVAAVERRFHRLFDRASAYISSRPTFADQIVDGVLFMVEHGEQDDIIRMLFSPDGPVSGADLLGRSGVGAMHMRELWAPILTAAQHRGDMRAGLNVRRTCAWLAHLQLSFLARLDLAELSGAERARMLREYVVPALVGSPRLSSGDATPASATPKPERPRN